MLDRAARESDPDERSRLGGLAAINRLLHPTRRCLAGLEKTIARKGLRGGLPDARELMKQFDVLHKLTQRKK